MWIHYGSARSRVTIFLLCCLVKNDSLNGLSKLAHCNLSQCNNYSSVMYYLSCKILKIRVILMSNGQMRFKALRLNAFTIS